MSRSKRWCFTLNNFSDNEFAILKQSLSSVASYAIIGRERGESGTPHLQGYVEFRERQRLAQCKKHAERAHWEPARGDAASNTTYCSKEESDPWKIGEPAVHRGAAGGGANRERYDAAIQHAKDGNLLLVDSDILLRCYGSLARISNDFAWERAASGVRLPEIVLKPWQNRVLSIIEAPPHDRTIYFVYDSIGGAGKTTFAKYLQRGPHGADVQVLHPARGVDICYLLKPRRIYVFDCPRASAEFVPWATIESIKDGMVQNTKYECCQKVIETPHVFVFTNFECPEGKLSEDRIEYLYCE